MGQGLRPYFRDLFWSGQSMVQLKRLRSWNRNQPVSSSSKIEQKRTASKVKLFGQLSVSSSQKYMYCLSFASSSRIQPHLFQFQVGGAPLSFPTPKDACSHCAAGPAWNAPKNGWKCAHPKQQRMVFSTNFRFNLLWGAWGYHVEFSFLYICGVQNKNPHRWWKDQTQSWLYKKREFPLQTSMLPTFEMWCH